MRARARLGVVMTLALPGMAGAQGEGTRPSVRIAAVRDTIDDATQVGPKRTGMICGPVGHVVWAEAKPDPVETADAIVDALRARGIGAVTHDRGADDRAPSYVVTAVVTAARISACVPQHGLARLVGGRRRLKVAGRITVRWTVSRPGAAGAEEFADEQPVGGNVEVRDMRDAVRDAVATSAGRLPPLLLTDAPPG